MKLKAKVNEEVKSFKPCSVTITMETADELMTLWHTMNYYGRSYNASIEQFTKQEIIDYSKLDEVMVPENRAPLNKLFQVFNALAEDFGLVINRERRGKLRWRNCDE